MSRIYRVTLWFIMTFVVFFVWMTFFVAYLLGMDVSVWSVVVLFIWLLLLWLFSPIDPN